MKNILILGNKYSIGGIAIWFKYLTSGLSKNNFKISTQRPSVSIIFSIHKYQLIHICEFSIYSIILIFVARIYKVPVISTVHGDLFASNAGVNPVRKSLILSVARFCLANSSHVTTPSTYLRNILQKSSWIRSNKVSYIQNPIDIKYIRDIKPYSQSGNINLVQITNFRYPQKARGVIDTIKAVENINVENLKLIIIGGRGYYAYFKKKYASKTVLFKGPLSHSKTIRNIKSANIIIHTSYLDNAPISLIEGMACGKPVVCYDTGGIKELVGDSAILCHPSKLKSELYSLINDKTRQAKLSKKAKARSSLYSNRIISKRFESLYNSLIDG